MVEEFKNRRDALFVRKDVFVSCIGMVELRRASSAELRGASLRVKERSPLADASGLEDALGPGGEVPSDGKYFLLMSAQTCGSGTRADRVALGSVDRIRLSRAPRVRYEYLLGSGAQ